MSMSSGSIGSHRAFMGVCITLCVCLSLTMFVGWRWYFDILAQRNMLIEIAEKAEARARDLEKMGLLANAKVTDVEPESSVVPSAAVNVKPPSDDESKPKAANDRNALYPSASVIKELPLQESGDDVVQALAMLEKYWKTETWKERLPMVVDADRVSKLMADFYETQGGRDPQPGGMLSKARYLIDGHEILYFSYTSSRPTGSLEVALRRGPTGQFLLDWESLVSYGDLSFQDLRAKRPEKPVQLRAYVRLFEYYNFEFSDSKKYLCVKVGSENSENSIYAYCQRSSPLGRWLEAELASTGPTGFKGFTLEVSFPANAQSNQCVQLDKVNASRWLLLP